MITLIDFGYYRLFKTKTLTKILSIGTKSYAWIYARGIGDILVKTSKQFAPWDELAYGQFRIFTVDEAAGYSDQIHLELQAGDGDWQGYLLPSGLPTANKTRVRIIPTYENITTHAPSRRVAQPA